MVVGPLSELLCFANMVNRGYSSLLWWGLGCKGRQFLAKEQEEDEGEAAYLHAGRRVLVFSRIKINQGAATFSGHLSMRGKRLELRTSHSTSAF
jgi:hypothetical protein